MAFVGVKISGIKSLLLRLFEQACGAEIKKRFDNFVVAGQKFLPNFFERLFGDISKNYSTAGAAEDIAVGVDVNAFRSEKGLFAGFAFYFVDWFFGYEFCDFFCCPACESKGVFFQ